MATRMQQRRGTAADWAAANPVLADGEIGFVTDTGEFKLGNGSTAWNALPAPYIPKGLADAIGDLLVGTADNTVGRLPSGTVGQRLTSQADGSLAWETPVPSVPNSVVDAKGDLIVGTANDTVARLARGTTGQRLTVEADGSLAWETPVSSIPVSVVDAKGDLVVGTADNTVARLARGTTGQRLTVQADGSLAYETPTPSIPLSIITAQSDIVVGLAPGSATTMPKGAAGQHLVMDAADALNWQTPRLFDTGPISTGQSIGTNSETIWTPAADMNIVVPTGGGRIFINGELQMLGGADDVANFKIRDGGTSAPTLTSTLLYQGRKRLHPTAQAALAVPISVQLALTAGTHRLCLTALTTVGAGTIGAGSQFLSYLVIEPGVGMP